MVDKVFKNSFANLSNKDRTKAETKNLTKLSPETLLLARNLLPRIILNKTMGTTKTGTPIPEDNDISKMLKTASTAVRDARNILKSSPELCMAARILKSIC